MKRVLVGFDGSEGAQNALSKATMMIDDDGEIILLAIIPLPSGQNLLDQKTAEAIKEQAYSLIDKAIHDLGAPEFTVNGLVRAGADIAAVIIDVANEVDCDLIVLGSRGASALGKYPIGSVANKVVQYAAKPVMVVR